MIESVRVELGERSYGIEIGPGARRRLREWLADHAEGRQLVIIADATVADLHLARLRSNLPDDSLVIPFEPGENSKSLATAERIFLELGQARVERRATLITFGGGVAGDLGGFIAATWLRGIPFVQVPTTLLAAVDASVGGKTGVNLSIGKNLVGAFHQPRGVFVDTDFFATLPDRDYRAGLAESVKHAVIQDAGFLAWHEQHADQVLNRHAPVLSVMLARDCGIKARVVSADEREGGLRAILNYGHTVGHAIEHLLGYELRHGECVALGMIVEGELAAARGLRRHDADRVRRLLEQYGLPIRLPHALTPADIIDVCQLDKKVSGGAIRFALVTGLGQPLLGVEDVSEAELSTALEMIQPDA